ncbi:MAG TPA: glycoside hydrolase family 5 protein [Jatrophihabitantaceae bacterium]
MPLPTEGFVRTSGATLLDGKGAPLRLRGVGLGGWLNMENFITGYAANEQTMRDDVRAVLGNARYNLFFDRLLTAFFGDADAAFLADVGMNCVRIPINYRHFEDDRRPFELVEEGFAQLDRVIDACARHGLYSIIDVHALPGAQNQHWHSDNPTNVANFWLHPHFQDRAVWLWQILAERYRDDPRVAGFNPINEPAGEDRSVVRAVYQRLYHAIRAVDDRHVLFLDGNTYSTEFDVFDGEFDNVVYSCHDYAVPGLIGGQTYPGQTADRFWDKDAIRQKYLDRTAYSRETGTPVWVGEFGPVYVGDRARDAMRYQVLTDQLDIYAADGASWSLWTYKDVGRQGMAVVRRDSQYLARFGDFIARKDRLGADRWGSSGDAVADAVAPFAEMMNREFPDVAPYPWGLTDWTRTLLLNVTLAVPLSKQYAALFADLSDDELVALAESFAFENCVVRQELVDVLRGDLGSG